MQLIPVIDLKNQQVVHAVGGHRQHYQPINQHSILTQHSDLPHVLDALWQHFTCRYCYIADLDAITGTGEHTALIERAAEQNPQIEFWLDNGSCWTAAYRPQAANIRLVIGTESQTQAASPISNDCILSLDYLHGQPSGHCSWFTTPSCWPQTVIAMTLKQVGSQNGPDWQTLTSLLDQHPEKHWIAAGGIRNTTDLQQLAERGVYGALVATALHNGSIQAGDIVTNADRPEYKNAENRL